MRSILMTLRYNLFFIQCTPFGGVDLLTLRHEFISCSALHLMGSVSLTLRYEFISCSALTSVGSISLTLRHLNPAVDYSLTSRLWACCNCLLIVRWEKNFIFFCWSQKSVIPLMKSFQLQKNVEAGSSICLRKGPSWSSPFKVAKMITIWPQNCCISPGLAGNRVFVFAKVSWGRFKHLLEERALLELAFQGGQKWSPFGLRIVVSPLVWLEIAILFLWPLFHFLSPFFLLQLFHACVQVPQGKGKAVSVLF